MYVLKKCIPYSANKIRLCKVCYGFKYVIKAGNMAR